MSRLLPPLFVGCGVGIILFGARNDLPTPAYFVSIPFWPMLVMPSGLLWRNKILNTVNKGQFPPEMRNYRQLFVFNRKAVIYQLFFNQIGYHTLLGAAFMGYTYFARVLYDQPTPRKSFASLLNETALGFVKLRMFFLTISLFSEFWGCKLNLKASPDGSMHISPNTIRMLLIKETILNVFWMSSIAKLVHDHYPSIKDRLGEAQ